MKREDAPQISGINEAFHGVKRDVSFWIWKYYRLPSSQHYMAVGEVDGRIVGQTGCIGQIASVNNERYLCGQTQDILVLEEFRKGRMFFKIEKRAREMGIEQGSFFDFGFAIELTKKISTRMLGFSAVGPIKKMVRPLNLYPYFVKKFPCRPLARVASWFLKPLMKRLHLPTRCKLAEHWRMEEIFSFDDRFDRLWSDVKDRYSVILERSSEYLNWRYIEHPEVQYHCLMLRDGNHILGFIVLEIKERPRRFDTLNIEYVDAKRGEIVDILVGPGAERDRWFDSLLRGAFSYFVRHDVDVISCWCFPHMEVARHLSRYHFQLRQTPHDLIVRSHRSELGPDSPIFDAKNWYMMRGDSDHY
ncbi:MAG: hypothetical protein SV775_01200 [Thermodesulfobacteriota bacterium]|nr:hypothetical protein [Thermodesulfobacteriota bacterium]